MPDPETRDLPSADAEPPGTASLLRRVVFRAVLMGGVLALLLDWYLLLRRLERPVGGAVFAMGAIAGFSVGMFIAPVFLAERVFGRWRPTVPRDLALGAIALALAFVAVVLAFFQLVYFLAAIDGVSLDLGVSAMADAASELLREPGRLNRFVPLAAPFAPLAVARLRGLSLWKQTVVTFAIGGVLAVPSCIWLFDEEMRGIEGMWLPAALGLVLLLLPIASAGADELEERVARRLSS